MALALVAEPAQPQPQILPMPLARRIGVEADLTCLMCGRAVGTVVKGRAYHHAGCAGRLRVDRGLVRCCQCSGPVYREPVAPLTRR